MLTEKQRLTFHTQFVLILLAGLTAVGCSPSAGKIEAPDLTAGTASPVQDNLDAPQGADPPPQVNVIHESDLPGLLQEGRGKITVINLWATWCPPCVMELPHMSEFYRSVDQSKVHFIALSFDDPESLTSTVKPFLKQKKVPFPVHIMGGRDVDAISSALKTTLSGAIPTTLIYDSAGNLKIAKEGAVSKEWLDSQIKTISS